MIYEQLTHKIIGCAMKVHTLGGGLQELIYQRANYLQAYHLPVGLLINFGAKSMEFKRAYTLNHPSNAEFIKNTPKIN